MQGIHKVDTMSEERNEHKRSRKVTRKKRTPAYDDSDVREYVPSGRAKSAAKSSGRSDGKSAVRKGRKPVNRRRPVQDPDEPDRDMIKSFFHKLIAALVAILLIVVVIIVAFGNRIKLAMDSGEGFGMHTILMVLYPEKYSYSTETADMNEYFRLFSDEDIAIILQDERLESRAKLLDGKVYFSSETVYDLFTKRFYINEEEGVLLYTTSNDIYRVSIDDSGSFYQTDGGRVQTDYDPAKRTTDGVVYIAADYVKLFDDFSYEYFPDPNRMQVYTQWGTDRVATVAESTHVRYQGGVKSDVLRALDAGEKVEVLETMENWTKIKTNDCFIGYVENSKLKDYADENPTPVTGAYDPVADYSAAALTSDERILLGFHQISAGPDNGKAMESLTVSANGLNTVSPTWFFLKDEEGEYTDLGSSAYVEAAHAKGYQVWALFEDMTNDVDEYALFSSSSKRKKLIEKLMASVETYGLDGLNIDIERIDSRTGPHYVQFLRELSIETRRAGIVLSVDDYPPNQGNRYYNYGEQGLVADYVVLMQYDEHWSGSDPGSVSSLPFVEKGVDDSLELGVPTEKIISALPFYTRIWRAEGTETHSDSVGMTAASDFLANRGVTPVWDEELCQNYGEYQDGTAKYMIWLEDEASMRAKLNVLAEKGVHNIAGWRLGLEAEGTWNWIDEIIK